MNSRKSIFFVSLKEVLSSCTNLFRQECYILGDFNTDILAEKSVLKKDFENFLRIFDLKQIITEPTRVTDTSETAIDLICTSDVANVSQSGVLPWKLSEHNVILCTRKLKKCPFKGHNNVQLRIMKSYDKGVFVDKLSSLDWTKVSNDENVNDSWKTGSWFKSYLAGRKQVVKVNGSVSTAGNITCGVQQGSILGPLLFIIYVNDMVTSVNCDLFLYADDSTLLVSGKHPTDIQKSLSNELNSVRGWLEENKLSIHLGKTESILIASKIRLARTDSLQIYCGNVAIESKSKITYLGLTFDSDMSFSSMGNSVIKKVNAKLKFLYRKRDFFGANERKLLCSALVNPHFEYACNAWYRSVNAKVKNKLQTAQNKMIRYLLNYGCRRHIGFNDFKKSNFLDINARVDYMSLNMMFNIFNNVAPSYMCDIDRITHSHNTRHSDSACVVPRVKGQGSKSFKFNGCKLWNELPTNVKNAQQKFRFKKECKTLLMTKMKLKEEMNCVP